MHLKPAFRQPHLDWQPLIHFHVTNFKRFSGERGKVVPGINEFPCCFRHPHFSDPKHFRSRAAIGERLLIRVYVDGQLQLLVKDLPSSIHVLLLIPTDRTY